MERCIFSSAARRSPFTLGRTADRTRSERQPRRGGRHGREAEPGGARRGRAWRWDRRPVWFSLGAVGGVEEQLKGGHWLKMLQVMSVASSGWQPPAVGFGGSLGSRRRIARTPPSTRRTRPRCRRCRPLPDQAAGDRGGRRTRRERWRWLSPATCTRGWCLPGRTHDSYLVRVEEGQGPQLGAAARAPHASLFPPTEVVRLRHVVPLLSVSHTSRFVL
jgi:hypothetical protein